MIVLFPGLIIMKNLYRLSYMNPKAFKMCIDALDSISRFSVMFGHFPFSWVSMTQHIASGATSNPLILYLTLTLSHCPLVFKCVCL